MWRAITLVPSASEHARKFGKTPAFYNAPFPYHATYAVSDGRKAFVEATSGLARAQVDPDRYHPSQTSACPPRSHSRSCAKILEMSPETMIKLRPLHGNDTAHEIELTIADTAFKLDVCFRHGGVASRRAIAPCAIMIALYLETLGRNPHESPSAPAWLASSVVGRGPQVNSQVAMPSACGYRIPVAQRSRSP